MTCVTTVIPQPPNQPPAFSQLNCNLVHFLSHLPQRGHGGGVTRITIHHHFHSSHTGPRSFERFSIKQLLRAEQQVRGRSIAVAAGRLGKLC